MFGACVKGDASRLVNIGLISQQHRGQESAGIAAFDGKKINLVKGVGLISEVIDNKSIDKTCGATSIGHVNYCKSDAGSYANAQPLMVLNSNFELALAFNGKVYNAEDIKKELSASGAIFGTTSDAEIIGHLIARFYEGNIEHAIARAMEKLEGACSLIILNKDEIYVARDVHGIRPLVFGKSSQGYFVSAESCALDTIGANIVRDVNPGEIARITSSGIETLLTMSSKGKRGKAGCIFEYVYISRPDSIIDGISVNTARYEMGRRLFMESGTKADVIVPVPESGVAAAIGYSAESGVPYCHAIIKNRYVGRTFIQPTQEERELTVDIKLNFVPEAVAGKSVILVDDSIVRGTTSRRLISLMRRAGAKEVHLRVCSPPVMDTCRYGIDTSSKSELIATYKTREEIREFIGADSLYHISEDGMLDVAKNLYKVGHGEAENVFCTACFDSNYPDAKCCECNKGLSYKDSGVNIDAGNTAVEMMKPLVKRTMIKGNIGGIGGFGGLFNLDTKEYRDPVLVTSTDGVGTKLNIAFSMDKHDTIGIDAVAMCVNDILVSGAKPIFFLDYIACGKLDPKRIVDIVKGVSDGCVDSQCSLIGGETAEMPGFYQDNHYDIAGFSVGVVEKDEMIDGSKIAPGDVLIGIASSGVHSNGFSLVRKVLFDAAGMGLSDKPESLLGKSLGDVLLTPTKIYVRQILELKKKVDILGMAHITGGGLIENPPRAIPDGTCIEIDTNAWKVPEIFELIKDKGNVDTMEMYRVTNMGIGFVVIVRSEQAKEAIESLEAMGEQAYVIGCIKAGPSKEVKLTGV